MTDPADQPTREDAAYAAMAGFLQRHAAAIAIAGPFLFVALLFPGSGAAYLLLGLFYIAEAIAYAGVQRRRGVRPLADPAASLHAGARWVWRLAVVIFSVVVTMVVTMALGAAAARIGL